MNVQWIIIGVVVFVLILIAIRSIYEIRNFKVTQYTIYSDKVCGELKFGYITDLHNCNYGKDNDRLINEVKSLGLEFMVLGGDMICGKRQIKKSPKTYYKNATAFLRGISGSLPIYYVYGNHETRVKNRRNENPLYNSYMESIKNLEITDLNDRTAIMYRENNSSVYIMTGLEINEEAYDDKNSLKISDEAFSGISSVCSERKINRHNCFNIIVAHTPEFFCEYKKRGADLVLSGHFHGGTVRLPFVGGIVSRDFKLFPRYSYGEYKMGESKMILSGGLGDHTIHFRLFNRPEIVVINIKPEKVFEKHMKSDRI